MIAQIGTLIHLRLHYQSLPLPPPATSQMHSPVSDKVKGYVMMTANIELVDMCG